MNPYSALPLGAFVLNLLLSTWVAAQNRRSPLNKAFLAMSLPMAGWALCEFISWNAHSTEGLTMLYRIEGLFWIPVGFLTLRFAYALLRRKPDVVYHASLLLTLAAIGAHVAGDWGVRGATGVFYGNKAVNGPLFLPVTLVSAGSGLLALVLILKQALSAGDPIRRKPLAWFGAGLGCALFISVLTEMVFPTLFPHSGWMELGPSSTTLVSLVTFGIMLRFRFLSLGVEDFAEGLFNALGEGVLITDEHFFIRKANPTAVSLFGVGTLEGMDARKILPGFSPSVAQWELTLDSDGAPRHLIAGSAAFTAFGAREWRFIFLVDHSATVLAQKALAESEQRFRETIDLVPVAILELDLEGGVRHANRTAYAMFGYRPDDVAKGLNGYRDIIVREDHERARANFAQIAAGRLSGTHEYQLRRRDGTLVRGLLSSAPLLRDGALVGLRTCISDITELESLRSITQRNQRLESLGLLAGGIAHDFNNILTIISGGVTLLEERIAGHGAPGEIAELLGRVEKAAARASTLTRQLLTFSKGGTPVKAPLDPLEVLLESAALALLGSPVAFDHVAPPDLPPVLADRDQLGQVFHNILLNAVQAMPQGGRVNVAVEAFEPTGSIAGLERRPHVVFHVDDSGPGIPEEQRPKIFDPYFTTKPNGTGLGLSISDSIVRRHGGAILVSRSPEGGARFSVYLPACIEAAPAPPAPAESPRQARTARILVMDDDAQICALLRAMLENMGHAVEVCHSGEEAVAFFRAHPGAIDLCILDLTIPGGMGGIEAMRRLRELSPGLRSLVSSGYSEAPVLSDPAAFGFCSILPKPYSYQVLREKIGQALA